MDFFGDSIPSGGAPSGGKKERAASKQEAADSTSPLPERMRPHTFEEVIGHEEIIGPGSFIAKLLERGAIPSLIFWGPPGCGKTTLANIIAAKTGASFVSLSAVTSGIKEVKEVIEQARARREMNGKRTVLFVDEIHRFNKAQQDAFLPHVENGTIILFGATTENPSFSVIAPLLSRCRVITLKALDKAAVVKILRRALEREGTATAEDTALETMAELAEGDARRALHLLEQCAAAANGGEIGEELLAQVNRRTHLLYDKSGEEHFNLISALHKSMRSSDPQAALYWLTRMLAAGEDPLYLARRMVRFASEDVGLADPQALTQSLAAVDAFKMLGSPEGELALAQCAVYLATAPKSNALYAAYKEASAEIESTGARPVPLHLRNAPTKLMKEIGYGKGYQYDPDTKEGFSGQECMPEGMEERAFYKPTNQGHEAQIAERLAKWKAMKQKA